LVLLTCAVAKPDERHTLQPMDRRGSALCSVFRRTQEMVRSQTV